MRSKLEDIYEDYEIRQRIENMPSETLSPQEFKQIQSDLKNRGGEDDRCGDCGCKRNAHVPKDFFMYAKSGFSSGQAVAIPNLAPTHCDCKHCLCSCVAFVEPALGQRPLVCFGDPQ
jgi:hypothetical protein